MVQIVKEIRNRLSLLDIQHSMNHLAQNSYVGNGDVFVSKLNNNLDELTSGVVFGGTGKVTELLLQ